MQRLGRPKAPNIPGSLDNSVSSLHPHEFADVFVTMTEIWAASTDISQRVYKERLPAATLSKVSTFSKYLWEEIQLLPLSVIPSLKNSLKVYAL
jgi:hypothetical protein